MENMQINNILAPVDFSECSDNALKIAIDLTKLTGGNLVVLHGFSIPIGLVSEYHVPDEVSFKNYETTARAQLEELPSKFSSLNDISVTYRFVLSLPLDAVLTTIEEEYIDLVVMGTKGAGNIIDNVLGSTTSTLIHKTLTPVLVIPKHFNSLNIKKIAVAVDFDQTNDFSKLIILRELASLLKSEINILNASAENPKERGIAVGDQALELHNIFKDLEHEYFFIDDENITRGISEFIITNNVDLITLLPKNHTFFERLLKKSVTKGLALHTNIPLLAIHE